MIDWSAFNMYLKSFGQEMTLKLIDMFIADYPANISKLKMIVEARDFSQLQALAHNLKSNCALFGGTEAADCALKLEMMGKEQVNDQMDEVFARFLVASEDLVRELRTYRSTLS
jgi:HPt (histidine-containing phosphotransfer) domain-containing protein